MLSLRRVAKDHFHLADVLLLLLLLHDCSIMGHFQL
jgi:hypothetical protein